MRLRAFDRDLICGEHYGQRPSQSAATTGSSRACKHALPGKGTDGSTDQHCITVEKSLADREPSTDGENSPSEAALLHDRYNPLSGHSGAKSGNASITTGLFPGSDVADSFGERGSSDPERRFS